MARSIQYVVTARDSQELYDSLSGVPSGQRIVGYDYDWYHEDGKDWIEITLRFETE